MTHASAATPPTTATLPDHHTRATALDAWLAREAAVAAGVVARIAPELLGLPDRETLLRTLFQRWTTTLEGALDTQLDLGTEPLAAVRAAYRNAAAHRPADWRALRREARDPVVVEMTRRQHLRMARAAGLLSGRQVGAALDQVACVAAGVAVDVPPLPAVHSRRRRPAARPILARRTG